MADWTHEKALFDRYTMTQYGAGSVRYTATIVLKDGEIESVEYTPPPDEKSVERWKFIGELCKKLISLIKKQKEGR